MDGRIARAVRQRLESLAQAGVTAIPRCSEGRTGTVRQRSIPEAVVPGATVATRRSAPDERIASLAVLRQQVVDCTRCTELAATRTQTVFGSGSPSARLCFLGEAPGADEDASGEPFVGRAGQLLTKIIEACRLTRNEVYILNVLKCRPPGNRVPAPEEVGNCRQFLQRQFEIIAPEYVCCLGTTAAQSLLQTTDPIGTLRRRWFQYGTARVLCTYHPSYLLRNPAAKKAVWDDMRMLMACMGVEL